MAKMFIFFVFTFAIGTALSFLMEGQQAFAATNLNGAVSKTDTSFTVDSTAGFRANDFLLIDAEFVCNVSVVDATTFSIVSTASRGCEGTDAAAHTDNTRVYSEGAGLINQTVGFNVASALTDDSANFFEKMVGSVTAAVSLVWWLAKTVFKMVAWDYAYLEGDLHMLKLFLLYPLSAGLVFSLTSLVVKRG